MIFIRIFAVLLLVGINGFFAAAEFSLVAVRPSRIRLLIEQGDARAKIVHDLLQDLPLVVSGVQFGMSLASLGLGFVGEITLAVIMEQALSWIPGPWLAVYAHTAAIALAFLLLTYMHVVLGELVPKTVSLQRAEGVALLCARPFRWFLRTFRPAINVLDTSAEKFSGWLGVRNPHSHTLVHSAEELRILIQQARERGVLQLGEEQFIHAAMELGQVQVREVMVPRPDIHMLPAEADMDQVMRVFATTQRSRLPVYQGTPDHIIGFVHIKDMLWILLDRERRAEEGLSAAEFELRRVLRDVLIVPETKPASELLAEMRARCVPLAMAVDEFGSILGLVTLEDILEQLVGEIHDEFDVVERPLTLADGAMVFDAALNVRDLENQYNIVLPEDPAYETVGGFVLAQLGFIPRGGESFEFNNHRFTVVEMDRRRVARVKIQRLKKPVPAAAPPETAAAPVPRTGTRE
ncbi:MAG TPA: hemolysin family protein [Candidatus Acidoferrales bacterium]|nr:hemolysin family protein [Candidatus Acidoferrales bacterium]